MFDSIPKAVEVRTVSHRSRNNFCFSDPERPIRYLLEMDGERHPFEAGQCCKQGLEKMFGAVRTDHRERRPSASLIFREDHSVEEESDEV